MQTFCSRPHKIAPEWENKTSCCSSSQRENLTVRPLKTHLLLPWQPAEHETDSLENGRTRRSRVVVHSLVALLIPGLSVDPEARHLPSVGHILPDLLGGRVAVPLTPLTVGLRCEAHRVLLEMQNRIG